MEILPSEVSNKISQEIADKKLSIDFDTVVGLVVGWRTYVIVFQQSMSVLGHENVVINNESKCNI